MIELYPNFPYIMEEATYRTIMVTIVGVLSPVTIWLLIRYFKYRKQQDYDKKIRMERLRIQVGAIAAGIKDSKNIQANGDFKTAYNDYIKTETANSLILNPIKAPENG